MERYSGIEVKIAAGTSGNLTDHRFQKVLKKYPQFNFVDSIPRDRSVGIFSGYDVYTDDQGRDLILFGDPEEIDEDGKKIPMRTSEWRIEEDALQFGRNRELASGEKPEDLEKFLKTGGPSSEFEKSQITHFDNPETRE